MSQDLHQHAEEIFSEAIDRSGKARSDFLARTCGDDPELRNEVDSLISHYESTENVLTSRGGSSHSISAGLDYPGVGPEHAHWKDSGRVEYRVVDDAEALNAFQELSRLEGIIPALETAHAIAASIQLAAEFPAEANLVLNCSGRGDKDVQEVMRLLES